MFSWPGVADFEVVVVSNSQYFGRKMGNSVSRFHDSQEPQFLVHFLSFGLGVQVQDLGTEPKIATPYISSSWLEPRGSS